jgi:hypothetical protein
MKLTESLDGAKVYDDFAARVAELEKEGLCDFKLKLHPSKDTSVDGILVTLGNVLRLRSLGQFNSDIDVN